MPTASVWAVRIPASSCVCFSIRAMSSGPIRPTVAASSRVTKRSVSSNFVVNSTITPSSHGEPGSRRSGTRAGSRRPAATRRWTEDSRGRALR